MKGFTALPEDRDPKILGIFTKDRQFYRTFFPLLLTISLQQLAAFMVNMVDNIMLGTYSELALSGATLVNQLQFCSNRLHHASEWESLCWLLNIGGSSALTRLKR